MRVNLFDAASHGPRAVRKDKQNGAESHSRLQADLPRRNVPRLATGVLASGRRSRKIGENRNPEPRTTMSHAHFAHHVDHDDHHEHDDHHGHGHAPTDFGRAFAIAATLNIALVVAQVIFGVLANSVALIADAGHNLGDVLGLLLAWGAHGMARWQPTRRYTYGFRSASILAALFNSIILLVATGAIAWEALRRLSGAGDVEGVTVMVVAAAGIVINGVSAWLLMAGREGDLNIRGAFLHMVADAAISLGVVAAGAVILSTGWNWLDPVASLVIAALIVWGTWGLLREAVMMSLNAVPQGVDGAKVESYLRGLPGVRDVHDLHIWAMSTTETAMTAHLVRPGAGLDDHLLHEVCHELEHRFGISHATLQVESGDTEHECRLAPDHVV
jgi:cobalt-zinc-cadmium efflux system protein